LLGHGIALGLIRELPWRAGRASWPWKKMRGRGRSILTEMTMAWLAKDLRKDLEVELTRKEKRKGKGEQG